MSAAAAGIRDFPDNAHFLVELARLHKVHGRQTELLDAIERAAAIDPEDPDLQVVLGTGLIAEWDMKGAADALNRAVALDPKHSEAHILLAVLHEHDYRPDCLPPLIAAAKARGVDAGAIALMEAMAFRREDRFEEGLAELRRVPDDLEPLRRAQLTGQCEDRLGHAEAAMSAFIEMNRLQSLDPSEPLVRADRYREALERDIATVTPEWFASWTPPAPSARPSPIFLVGFPRSGTTLLDTLLMGHPGVTVLEEKPALRKVEEALGGIANLPALGIADLERLRDIYFEEAARDAELDPAKLLVDKLPLHLNKVPIIHRLFPDARFILALRHPCDVVLSCFITNFRLTDAMASYLSLENTARIYDLSFGFWERARSIMPIRSHSVMYERVVSDIATELRPLFDFLGLDWIEGALDHRQTAEARGVISTPSYVQVTEPIYDRSAGRWNRYRAWLEPLFPVLQPWIERYGYAIQNDLMTAGPTRVHGSAKPPGGETSIA
jgi:tetratricopeptide (TPR) repeat protein